MYPIALIVAGEVRSLRCKGQLRSEAVTTHISRNLLSTAVVSLFFMAMPAWAQTTLEAPTDLVKEVIYNELHPADAANVRWKYQLAKEADGKNETRTVVETSSGTIDRLLTSAGKPLTDAQDRSEAERIMRLSRDPEQQRKADESRRKDAEQCNTILNMIPAAFIFSYAGQTQNAVKLTFRPNPAFRPPSREGKVLQQMAGEMLVDINQKRLISIDGQLIHDVKFGGGLLGHLEKGGRFAVRRTQLARGDWEMTELNVNMQGKALLFKNINVQQKEVHSNFERLPDDLSLAEGANLLLRQSVIASKGTPATINPRP